ncbi:MAG: heme-binding protein [Kovacikia sp.]
MKTQTIIVLIGLLAIPVIGFGVYRVLSAPLPEGFPPPTPAAKIEVKNYPAYRCGTYRYQGPLSQAANVAFGPLYSHISSNNIPMTAPVEARYPLITLQENPTGATSDEKGQAEVSFLYRNRKVQPQQVAPGIKVEDQPPMTVVSIGFRGPYTFTSYQRNLQQLNNWLKQHPNYTVVGSPRRLFYDSPFIPDTFKRSEVQIPIK